MKTPSCLAIGILLTGLLAGCRTNPGDPASRWNVDAVGPRIMKAFTGYRADRDGSYLEYQERIRREQQTTLRRHLFNNNPDNPFEVSDAQLTKPRPPFGPLPNPVRFVGVDGLALGGVMLAWTGGFIPIPLNSIITLFTSEQGRDEAWGTLKGDWEIHYLTPPKPSDFEVENR